MAVQRISEAVEIANQAAERAVENAHQAADAPQQADSHQQAAEQGAHAASGVDFGASSSSVVVLAHRLGQREIHGLVAHAGV